MKKNKFEYKRVDGRFHLEEFSKKLDEMTIGGWEIINYFEDMMDKNTVLVRVVLKRPSKKTIL